MRPQGQKPKRANLPDHHPRFKGKRVGNWWEDEGERKNKAFERREVIKDIERGLSE